MGLARNFKWLWAGQTISLVGSAVSRLAIPTTAIFSLHASAFEVGSLGAATFVAFPVLGVFAGVWVDRWPRRRLMIACDIVRAFALGTLPFAAALHALTLAQLFIVAIVTSVASVFFDIAYQAYLPDVVDADSLHDANARLEASSSGAQIAGNAAAGALIASLGAALTIAIDAASFVLSIVSLACIRDRPRERSVAKIAIPFVLELRDGLDYVFSNRALLRIVLCTATSNLGGSMVGAVYLIFAYRTLHLTPTLVGFILAVGNAGFVGAFFAPRIVKRFGLPMTLVSSMGVAALAQFLVPLSMRGFTVPLLIAEQLIASAAAPIYNIAQVSWRQAAVPPELGGRMNATVRTIAWGTLPIGALIGAALATSIGIVPTLVVAAFVYLSAVAWLLHPDVRAIGRSRA
jgi:predicted MFS family arabinose efflux permease